MLDCNSLAFGLHHERQETARRREEEGGSSSKVAWEQGAPEKGRGKDRGEQSVHLAFGGLSILIKHLILEPFNSKFDLEHQSSLYPIRVNNGGENKDPKVSSCLLVSPTRQWWLLLDSTYFLLYILGVPTLLCCALQ